MNSTTLIPPPEFRYLQPEERDALIDAFAQSGRNYDHATRAKLLELINPRFIRDFLPVVSLDPMLQLEADLLMLSRVERLTDGTVPLAQWLRNAARLFKLLPQGRVFEAALEKASAGEMAVASMDASEAPARDFEEILTDGIDDMQDGAFLRIGADRLDGVTKLLVPRFDNGKQVLQPGTNDPAMGAGTGWLIAPDLLVTNYHVIRNRKRGEPVPSDQDLLDQVKNTQAHFFYDEPDSQGRKIGISALIAVSRDNTEDCALLRLAESPKVRHLPIRAEVVEPPGVEQTPKGTLKRGLAVNIVQHPGGGPKRVALRNNLVYSAEYPLLHYFTDTLGGSSGAPVFDDAWRVIALHRAAVQKRAELNGRTLGYINEGVQLHNVMKRFRQLAENDTGLAQALKEIDEAQTEFQD